MVIIIRSNVQWRPSRRRRTRNIFLFQALAESSRLMLGVVDEYVQLNWHFFPRLLRYIYTNTYNTYIKSHVLHIIALQSITVFPAGWVLKHPRDAIGWGGINFFSNKRIAIVSGRAKSDLRDRNKYDRSVLWFAPHDTQHHLKWMRLTIANTAVAATCAR